LYQSLLVILIYPLSLSITGEQHSQTGLTSLQQLEQRTTS
jgi:hypothetical protein